MVVSKSYNKLKCYLCSSVPNKQKKIVLHAFPKPSLSIGQFKKWLYALDLNERDEVKNLKICSKHFTDDDYCSPIRGRLKPCAVPSVKVPNPLPKSDCEENTVRKDVSESSVEQIARNATEECIVSNQETTHERVNTSSNVASFPDAERSIQLVKELNVETEASKQSKGNSFLLQRGVRLLNSLLTSFSEKSRPVVEVEEPNSGQYNLPVLLKDIKRGQLPVHWSLSVVAGKSCLKYFGDQPEVATRAVIVKDDMTLMVQARGKVFSGLDLDLGTITCLEDLHNALKSVASLHLCKGLDGVCYGEGLLELRPRFGKCATCIQTRRRNMGRVSKAKRRALAKQARQAAKISDPKQDLKKVIKSRKKCACSSKVTACVQGVDDYSPLPMEEAECSLIPEMDEWRHKDEDRDPLELAGNDRCPLSKSVSRIEADVPGPLCSHSFTVPRYLLDHMISRLRRTRLKLRTVEDSLHVQTMQTESLEKTNEKLLEKITDLRKKVFELELEKSGRECKQGDQRVLVNKADNTPYNLKKAENDFLALHGKGLMPRFWSFVMISSGLLLLHDNGGPFPWPVGKSVLLKPDMTLSIRLLDRPMPNLNFGQMKSTMDILSALDTLASVRPCFGVCGNCLGEGVVSNAVRYPGRCETCRKECKRLRTEIKRKKCALLAKAEKRKLRNIEIKNLRQKLRRWQKKAEREEKKEITRLKQENLLLTQQHSSTSEIENIPPVQQEVVVTSLT